MFRKSAGGDTRGQGQGARRKPHKETRTKRLGPVAVRREGVVVGHRRHFVHLHRPQVVRNGRLQKRRRTNTVREADPYTLFLRTFALVVRRSRASSAIALWPTAKRRSKKKALFPTATAHLLPIPRPALPGPTTTQRRLPSPVKLPNVHCFIQSPLQSPAPAVVCRRRTDLFQSRWTTCSDPTPSDLRLSCQLK